MQLKIWIKQRYKQLYNVMAKIIKIQTGTADVVVTSEYETEEDAVEDREPSKCDVEVTEFKIDNTKWKKEKIDE